jgi:hypothetical protein
MDDNKTEDIALIIFVAEHCREKMMMNLFVVFAYNTDLVGCIRKVDENDCVDAYCNDIRMRIVKMLTLVSIGGGKPGIFFPPGFFGIYQHWKKKKVLQILVRKLK